MRSAALRSRRRYRRSTVGVAGAAALVLLFAAALAVVLAPGSAAALTVEVGGRAVAHVRAGDTWRFHRGTSAPSVPAAAWTEVGFDDSGWESGPGGFGYGDGDDATVLADMRDRYLTVYIRRVFTVDAVSPDDLLELVIDYDDGVVAYLNGAEVARRHVPAGPVDRLTAASSHEAGTPETISLGRAGDLLAAGANVLAIEGHNVSLGSSDFSLIASLRSAPQVVQVGESWIVDTDTVVLAGTVSTSAAVGVRIGAVAADLDTETGSWSARVPLAPGRNELEVEALDAGGGVIENAAVVVLRVDSTSRAGGAIDADTVWSGAVIVGETVGVAPGATLSIEPGTVVLLEEGVSIAVRGALEAAGTETAPIHFTHSAAGVRWGRILFSGAAASRLERCVVEYSDCEGDHKDYYLSGSRSYHEAVVVVASAVTIDGCTFQNLPDDGSSAEGDAIAIISDDPDVPGISPVTVRDCRFLSIGQGVHARLSPIVVENCFFTGKRGDNDDVDLWGESDPPPIIRNNVFLDPAHDDMINPTRCSAVITGNFISGSDDHGIVLRDRSFPVVMNNVIADCAAAGIAIENTCEALLVNNTIVDCGRGLRLFDLGRWGPPYRLTPGGGTATVVNCIIADCPQPITLADSPSTTIADRGSHVTVRFSLVEGGRRAISVSGGESTVTWGQGNIDADPLFVDPASGDFRVRAESPAIDAGASEGAPAADIEGTARPCGGAPDLGAYELCTGGGGEPRFLRGDPNADGRADISDAVHILLYRFAGGAAPGCLDSADANDDGAVDLSDSLFILGFLFARGPAPPPPSAACGVDPTVDALDCEAPPPCP